MHSRASALRRVRWKPRAPPPLAAAPLPLGPPEPPAAASPKPAAAARAHPTEIDAAAPHTKLNNVSRNAARIEEIDGASGEPLSPNDSALARQLREEEHNLNEFDGVADADLEDALLDMFKSQGDVQDVQESSE